MRTNVHPQKQDGFAVAVATIPLGDVTAAQLRIFADLASAYGDGTLRITTDQNALFRWVHLARLPELYGALAAAGFGLANAGTIADVVSCPGAESCRLAVTQSRGLGRLLGDHLRARADTAESVGAGDIKISGCPNGCGLHHVAAIGFQGSIRKLGARAVPQYFVMAGGGADPEGAAFGRIVAKVPARRCPEAVDRLVALYREERQPDEEPGGLHAPRRHRAAQEHAGGSRDAHAETPRTRRTSSTSAEDKVFTPEVLDGECSA
jgi:sulfite reductase (NADPH) hemoprotein beta-component